MCMFATYEVLHGQATAGRKYPNKIPLKSVQHCCSSYEHEYCNDCGAEINAKWVFTLHIHFIGSYLRQ